MQATLEETEQPLVQGSQQGMADYLMKHRLESREDSELYKRLRVKELSLKKNQRKEQRRRRISWNLLIFRLAFAMLVALSLASCSSDPEWEDPEAHEKTEQLRKQYTPFVVGTWHIESIKDRGRFYECLTFSGDGTLKGVRKWQSRELVTIDGNEQYTDWQDVDGENGMFSGTWKLSWSRDAEEPFSGNRLILMADFDEDYGWFYPVAYGLNAHFINADETSLSIGGGIVHNGDNGSTIYTRGEAGPSF